MGKIKLSLIYARGKKYLHVYLEKKKIKTTKQLLSHRKVLVYFIEIVK